MDDNQKLELMNNMAEKLPVFRKTLNLTQGELANMVGVSRSSITHIEKEKKMGWNTFLSLILIFTKNKETDELLSFYHIYTDELNEFINMGKKEIDKNEK